MILALCVIYYWDDKISAYVSKKNMEDHKMCFE